MLSRLKLVLFVCTALAFLGLSSVRATFSAKPEDEAVVIKMTAEHAFMPRAVTVKIGQPVEWVNAEEGGIHQVTTDADVASDPGDVSIPEGAEPFDSKLIKSGKSFRHEFKVPGVYKYACPPHENSGMVGQVTVTK